MSRSIKVASEIANQVSPIIQEKISGAVASVVKVELTPNLGSANIFVSIIGGDSKKLFRKIRNAKKEIRATLSKKLSVRRVPDLFFTLDDTMEYSQRISGIISGLS